MHILPHTSAPTSVNLILAVEFAMSLGLTFGAWMARRRWYRPHAWCQSLIVLLNLLVISTTMVPSFRARVLPKLPHKLAHSFYALATVHTLFASFAELFALYLILAAGTKILSDSLRPSNLKFSMRLMLATWWFVFLLGLATYIRWYVPLHNL